MSAEDTTSGSDPLSDDSSFYGDEDEKASLSKTTCEPFLRDYWTYHSSLPQTIAYQATAPSSSLTGLHRTTDLYNPYEGLKDAWQLHEPISEFLLRLPPSTTTLESVGPWIWIANPFERNNVKGKQQPADQSALLEQGGKLLAEFRSYKSKVQEKMANSAPSTVAKKAKPELEQLKKSLHDLAVETGCLSGKWMLFPKLEELDSTWSTVAQSISMNKLGTGAKVATLHESNGMLEQSSRLLCVYTRDFTDIKDLKRVLTELVDLGLVKSEGAGSRLIYYKSDAYTQLGIDGNNEYGLRASLFSSRDVLSMKTL